MISVRQWVCATVCMQGKFLRVAVMIYTTLVNTHTDPQILPGYTTTSDRFNMS